MEIAIALLAVAVLIKMSRKPTPVAKPVRKNARFGTGTQVQFPTQANWLVNDWLLHDINNAEQFEMALS